MVIVARESLHPCGSSVQHGQCADCGTALWRLLEADGRDHWVAVTGGHTHRVYRLSVIADRANRPRNRSEDRPDRVRPDRVRPRS